MVILNAPAPKHKTTLVLVTVQIAVRTDDVRKVNRLVPEAPLTSLGHD